MQANFNPVKISLTCLGASPLLSPRTNLDALSFLVMYHSKLLPHSYFFTALRQHFSLITYCCLSMYQQLQRHTIVKSTLGANPQTHPRKGTMKCGTNSQMQLNHQWVNTFLGHWLLIMKRARTTYKATSEPFETKLTTNQKNLLLQATIAQRNVSLQAFRGITWNRKRVRGKVNERTKRCYNHRGSSLVIG